MRVSIDLPTTVGAIYAVTLPGAKFDLGRSLSTGSVVFGARALRRDLVDGLGIGMAIGGTIVYRLREYQSPGEIHEIIAHEAVHVSQHDYGMTAFGDPFEGWLAGKAPTRLGAPLRALDFGSYASIKLLVNALGITDRDTPWEREAYFLVQDRQPTNGSIILTGITNLPPPSFAPLGR
jgi:hypothetical protein